MSMKKPELIGLESTSHSGGRRSAKLSVHSPGDDREGAVWKIGALVRCTAAVFSLGLEIARLGPLPPTSLTPVKDDFHSFEHREVLLQGLPEVLLIACHDDQVPTIRRHPLAFRRCVLN